jgi:alpha-tubulin suppressor-like RCC1 family protein
MVPVVVSGIADATQVSAGYEDSCALLAGGSVDCWGYNGYGELGDGTTTDKYSPVAVTLPNDASQITAGSFETCATLTDGSIDCWGSNTYGELGDGSYSASSSCVNDVIYAGPCSLTPVAVSGIADAIQTTPIAFGMCTLRLGGGIDCWGSNGDGELGDDGAEPYSDLPVAVSGFP